jgi:hypothetical protein
LLPPTKGSLGKMNSYRQIVRAVIVFTFLCGFGTSYADERKPSPVAGQVEFGDVLKSLLVKLPSGVKNDRKLSLMLAWSDIDQRFFGPGCFMECKGKIQGSAFADGKPLAKKSTQLEFEVDGPRGGATSIKFSMAMPDHVATKDVVLSLRKAGVTAKKIKCKGDMDFILGNGINVAAGTELTPPSYYKLSAEGYGDGLLVADIFDVDAQKDVIRFYTSISETKKICKQGAEF